MVPLPPQFEQLLIYPLVLHFLHYYFYLFDLLYIVPFPPQVKHI